MLHHAQANDLLWLREPEDDDDDWVDDDFDDDEDDDDVDFSGETE